MYSSGSVVGKASTVGIEISPTPLLIFTEGVKSVKFRGRLKYHTTLSRPRLKMQQEIWNLKQTSYVGMIALCLRQVWKLGPRTPENRSVKVPHSQKLHGENVLNRQ